MIEIVAGTNRRNSLSAVLARWLVGCYRKLGQDSGILDLSELGTEAFSPDAYQEKPEDVVAFTDRILASNGLVVVTPEYNGSMPGALKLFIDLLPFPESFEDRPVCYVGLSAGQFGALRPVEHLMQVFGYRNAHNFPSRVFLPFAHKILDADKGVFDESACNRLQEQARGFIDFCSLLQNREPRN